MKNSLAFFSGILYRNFITYSHQRLEEMGLSSGLLYFVLYIGKHPGCSPGELAEKLQMDSGHTTRSVDKLVNSAFVIREKSLEDKRKYILNLTEKGQQVFQLSYDLFEEWDQMAMAGLSKEESDLLNDLVKRVLRQCGESNNNGCNYYMRGE